jgi:formylglycine-generating enzyme required for sulfatase activity
MNAPQKISALVLVAVCGWSSVSISTETNQTAPPPKGMVLIPAGRYKPLFTAVNDPKAVAVPGFYLDAFPVKNREFLEFVQANPKWRRSNVKALFADSNYLKNWAGDLDPGAQALADAPVTYVSWFAAKAYATWKQKRLPATAEWEYAAGASPSRPDGENDPAFLATVRAWYASPAPATLPSVGRGHPNCFGVFDLHGLVWEWVADFNTAMVTGDARGDSGLDRQLFCGGGSNDARDRSDFPTFMRYGFRSSLKASYTVHNLGFRCAKDL